MQWAEGRIRLEETTWEPTSANFKFSLKAVKIGTDHRKIVLGRHAQNADRWKWWAGRPRDHPWRDRALSYVRRSQGSTTMFSVKTYISNIKTNLGNKTRYPKSHLQRNKKLASILTAVLNSRNTGANYMELQVRRILSHKFIIQLWHCL